MTGSTPLTALEAFLLSHPSIGYIPPTSAEYVPTASRGWIAGINARPLAIVQPQSPADVAALVKFAKSHAVPFTVRSGGHNLEGRSVVDGALLIDLRALTAVTIAPDRQSATVQGGILQGELASILWEEGLCTPTGSIPTVGYVGWATYGGYGPFSSHWGLGVDQIVEATVVDANGEIIVADECLLRGIRGAGGIFGIIVDVTIRVYPLTKLLAGAIIFDSSDIAQTIITFNAAYEDLLNTEGLPPPVTLQQAALNSPHGRVFAVLFTWSHPDLGEGQRWVEKISSLAPLLMSTVAPTTIPDWFAGNGALVPESVYGSLQTHNIRRINPVVAEVIGRNVASMPSDPGTMLSIHQLRGQSAGEDASKLEHSVFATREPHYMLEILGCGTDEQNAGTSEEWAVKTAKEVAQVDEGNVVSTAYVSLMRLASMKPDEAVKKAFGTNAEVVRELKERFDPENVFALALPPLK
ncbi:hypothetical protein ASPFODRAFT_212404 [Aspergillus luchuensis CBS 106.47]|uniref:FAD-binding PCMH-type domain-containing protein n=1 Tax=Aspergillus luchuensis (strain CBS 106.47) TaxID=1137211 RepID=A0A1M3T1M6_ASPLC|nr:hypothetical protein ASPFODRAFT_212404 [Aspergillus luchuensis CBS 106.47]